MATTSTQFIQEITENFHYSRRLLPEANMAPPPAAGISHDPIGHNNTIDANVIMALAVLVCALVCSLILNSIIKCAFKCSSLILADPSSNPSAKLANKGINKKALKTFPVIKYATELKHPGLDFECVICLSEFRVGERVKVLPKCNHGFHVRCIDKWLNSHSSCPTCRHCIIETCQKIINGGNNSSNTSSSTVQEVAIRIEPLQREGVISS